jgi:L-fucose isomerase-like protein
VVTAALISIARETFDVELATFNSNAAAHVLAAAGVVTVGSVTPLTDPVAIAAAINRIAASKVELVIVLQATFTDASPYVALATATDTPIMVWSFSEPRTGGRLRLNSFCGANLAAYSLQRRRHPVAFVHVDPMRCDADHRVRQAIEAALHTTGRAVRDEAGGVEDRTRTSGRSAAQKVARTLRHSRVGIVGRPPDGFEPCDGDEALIESVFGVAVERIELNDLFCTAARTPDDQVVATIGRIKAAVDLAPCVTPDDLDRSVQLFHGLKCLGEDHRLAAVATRCWPECMTDFGGAACAPQAMLTHDGVPCACEADVLGATTALMLHLVSGSEPLIADLVDIDEGDNTSVLWHCGVAATGLADPSRRPVGTVHPNRHRALIHQFALKPGRVTIARLSQADNQFSLVIGSGEMLSRPRPFDGTCGVLRWDMPIKDVASTIFGRGIEHHLGVVYGEHRDVLVELARLWQIPVIRLGHDPA